MNLYVIVMRTCVSGVDTVHVFSQIYVRQWKADVRRAGGILSDKTG